MSARLEMRLREAMADRAEYGMAYTDTQKELQRFKTRLAGNRRTRRVRFAIALAGTAAATVTTTVLAVTLTGGAANKSTANAPTLPADYPAGTWVRAGQDPNQGQLMFGDDAMARLQDFIGHNTEPLTFPGPRLLTFGPSREKNYCDTSGTYNYTVSAQHLHFQLVQDGCAARRTFLTQKDWQEAHP